MDDNTLKILVTGSRDWTDEETIVGALWGTKERLEEMYYDRPGDPEHPPRLVLVSGACPTGADAIAEAAWERAGLTVERHPADWKKHGKRAGYVRNAEMVAAEPIVCLAFVKDNSRGATMTVKLARDAGITVDRFDA